jgi:preprotein translocase subunit SecE
MAVAEVTKPETKKSDKGEGGDSGKPGKSSGGGLSNAATWLPRKWTELKNFFIEVRTELKKVTWPGKQEVYSTTIVIVFTTVFFGFYLWGVDLVYTQILTRLLR